MDMILAVDKDLTVHAKQTAEWAKYEIDTLRADSMSEAITRLAKGSKFLGVFINEDSIPDYASFLPLMHDVAQVSILVITSSFTVEKRLQTMSLGADEYERFNACAKDNVLTALEILKARERRSKHSGKKLPIIISGDLLLSPSHRRVCVKDREVDLAKKEFEILHCLMLNNGCYLTPAQLLRSVWGDEFVDNGQKLLWSAINRLRGKLAGASPDKEYIKAEREVGYKFLG